MSQKTLITGYLQEQGFTWCKRYNEKSTYNRTIKYYLINKLPKVEQLLELQKIARSEYGQDVKITAKKEMILNQYGSCVGYLNLYIYISIWGGFSDNR